MTSEPTYIRILVSNNPETWLWMPICKCATADYCPLHGYKTRFYPCHANISLQDGAILSKGEENEVR